MNYQTVKKISTETEILNGFHWTLSYAIVSIRNHINSLDTGEVSSWIVGSSVITYECIEMLACP